MKKWMLVVVAGALLSFSEIDRSHTGKAPFDPLVFTKVFDLSSPLLALAAADGRHFQTAILEVVKPGAQPMTFLKGILTDVTVKAYAAAASSGSNAPGEGRSSWRMMSRSETFSGQARSRLDVSSSLLTDMLLGSHRLFERDTDFHNPVPLDRQVIGMQA